jgi:ribosomal-protein-alanine N-acetyltransferase
VPALAELVGQHSSTMSIVTLRPVEEADLEAIARFSVEPDALGEFEWNGFTDPRPLRRRWEEDGLLADDSSFLAIVTPDGSFAGCVNWRLAGGSPTRGAPRRASSIVPFEIGIALLPEHRGQGHGSAAQAALVDYLFATTAVHRIQATTAAGNLAEQKALEKIGFRREGVLRGLGYQRGRWVDGVIYSLLRDDDRPSP